MDPWGLGREEVLLYVFPLVYMFEFFRNKRFTNKRREMLVWDMPLLRCLLDKQVETFEVWLGDWSKLKK